jgi:hypothetical protein
MNGYGVLSAILHRVKRNPKKYSSNAMSRTEWSKERIELQIGGLDSTADEHLDWLTKQLRIGDEVSIRLLSPGKFDVPKRRQGRLTARLRGTRVKAPRAPQRGR